MKTLSRGLLAAGLGLLVACTPSVRPAPSTPSATVSADCVMAWRTALASTSSGALDGPMRACGSLEEFAGGNAEARGGKNGLTPKVLAEAECRTGTFNAIPICRHLGIEPSPGAAPTALANGQCDDLIGQSTAGPSPDPLQVDPNRAYIGTGDTFFIGGRGSRWGENVEYEDGVFFMKIGIYTLDSLPPKVSAVRSDGAATGVVESAPTSGGLPGLLPTSVILATPGCWILQARGTTGVASIEVNVRPPSTGSGS